MTLSPIDRHSVCFHLSLIYLEVVGVLLFPEADFPGRHQEEKCRNYESLVDGLREKELFVEGVQAADIRGVVVVDRVVVARLF